jgi:hypothetical protein
VAVKTIGMVEVAALAAIGAAGPPLATITETGRRTNSAASADSRLSAQRYLGCSAVRELGGPSLRGRNSR